MSDTTANELAEKCASQINKLCFSGTLTKETEGVIANLLQLELHTLDLDALVKDRERLQFVIRMKLLQFVPPHGECKYWRVVDDSIGGSPVLGTGDTPEEAIDSAIAKEGE